MNYSISVRPIEALNFEADPKMARDAFVQESDRMNAELAAIRKEFDEATAMVANKREEDAAVSRLSSTVGVDLLIPPGGGSYVVDISSLDLSALDFERPWLHKSSPLPFDCSTAPV